LIRDAELVATMTGEEIPAGWVAIRDGLVEAVGRSGAEPEAEEVVSAKDSLVTPGLINTHHHIFQNLTRAYGPAANLSLVDWLKAQFPLWSRLDEEAVYVSTWVGLAELALGGCTTTTDHLYLHPSPRLIDAQITAAREVGLRFHPTRGSYSRRQEEGGLAPNSLVEDEDQILADSERLVRTYHDPSPGAMVRIALAPTSPWTVTPDLMKRTAELAERLDVRLHTHLAQDREEDVFCLERFGRRPVDYFEDVGWGGERSWVAHCIFVNQEEIRRLGSWGTGVAHCPSSNMLLAGGIAPVQEYRRAGVPVGLGCDGSASADHASLWLEARTALLLGRLRSGPTAMSARDALEVATVGSAACLGWQSELGVIKPGAPADLVVWPLTGVPFAGAHTDPIEALLRCAPVSARHTIVNGRFVVRDGRLTHSELEEMLQRHKQISRSWLAARIGAPEGPVKYGRDALHRP
jgi:cytosine/adenosine deaminase-related metal-dependent hydrolase